MGQLAAPIYKAHDILDAGNDSKFSGGAEEGGSHRLSLMAVSNWAPATSRGFFVMLVNPRFLVFQG